MLHEMYFLMMQYQGIYAARKSEYDKGYVKYWWWLFRSKLKIVYDAIKVFLVCYFITTHTDDQAIEGLFRKFFP